PGYWKAYQLEFTDGKEINLDRYLSLLVEIGYEHASMVTKPGEFSQRGGIIDMYPLTEKHPVRIELFDVEVDSIRYFDADTQRSLDRIDRIMIEPATELLLKEEEILSASEKIEKALAESLKNTTSKEAKEQLLETVEYD